MVHAAHSSMRNKKKPPRLAITLVDCNWVRCCCAAIKRREFDQHSRRHLFASSSSWRRRSSISRNAGCGGASIVRGISSIKRLLRCSSLNYFSIYIFIYCCITVMRLCQRKYIYVGRLLAPFLWVTYLPIQILSLLRRCITTLIDNF